MLTFSTDFPVRPDTTSAQFQSAVRTWIEESPHRQYRPDNFIGFDEAAEWNGMIDGDTVEKSVAAFEKDQAVHIHLTQPQGLLFWHTDLIFHRDGSDAWVGVRVSNDSDAPASTLPDARKPVVVKTLIEMLGGGIDGVLPVSKSAHFVDDTKVKDVADLILGRAEQRLPVIYVSHPFRGPQRNDANALANSLAGMGHVIVEPNSDFARRLQSEAGSTNAHNGAFGIYWPEGYGNVVIRQTGDARAMARQVVSEVRGALVNRRPLRRVTRAWFNAISSRERRSALDRAGSEQLADYTATFDSENSALKAQVEQAEQELVRLNALLRAGNTTASQSAIDLGEDIDLLPGERREVALEAIAEAAVRALDGTRKRTILDSITTANPATTARADARNALKSVLDHYQSMTKDVRNGLIRLGFSIEEGRHYKLMYQGDPRYTFILAKTASDHRNGKNLVSDIAQKVL